MRVLLVGPDHESNLSLLYLAASLRAAGHEPELAAFNAGSDAPAVLRAARRADLVGLSMCFQLRAPEFLALAEALKREAPARPVVAGGHHASCAAAELLLGYPALDAIVIHEGEETLVELAALGGALAARAGEVRGVAVRRDGAVAFTPPRPAAADLDRLPRPERTGPARLLCGVPTAYLMGSRGCVSDCDYCCITTLHRLAPGPRFRQRTPEDVADEMADLYHRRGVRQFVFHDDNFLVPSAAHNRARIARLDGALSARGVADVGLVLKCSPRDAEREALEALRRMGLLRLFMGVESGSACGLESIGRRRQAVADSERALALCEALGVSTQYTLIVFHPEATVASMLDDLAFAARHPAHPMNYCRAEIYAGTPLEARMRAAGRLEGTSLAPTYRYSDPRVETIWRLGGPLFAGRCWGEDELLGSVIRLDHQVAVLDRFYEGRRVRALVRSFRAWEADLNLETAALFRALVVAAGEASGAEDPALPRAVEALRRREAASRAARVRHLCEYRAALERYAHASVRLARRQAADASPGLRFVGPRHAAAVAAAIGLLGCAVAHDHGVAEAAPPPYGKRPPPPPPPPPGEPAPPPEARADACAVIPSPPPPPEPPVRHDGGVMEAPPPPYRDDQGVAEAAPPPYRFDHGVAEAAPPPYDRPVKPVARELLEIRTVPEVQIRNGPAKLGRPVRVQAGAVVTVSVGSRGLEATLALGRTGPKTTVTVRADAPLTVTCGKQSSPAPARVVLRDDTPAKARLLVLQDPATGARLEVYVTPVRVSLQESP